MSIKKILRWPFVVSCKVINKLYYSIARARLKNEDFTILCSTCLGGVIYHRLGKQFLSPTINLWMTQRDFIEFACNLKHYVSLKLNFIESNEETPVAMLGDIIIHFNHADSEEQAEQEWLRRKARINYDNIYNYT